jgi:hypothetical protein
MGSVLRPRSGSNVSEGTKQSNLPTRFLRRLRSIPLFQPSPRRFRSVYGRRPTPYYAAGHGISNALSTITVNSDNTDSGVWTPLIQASAHTSTFTTPIHHPSPRQLALEPDSEDLERLTAALENQLQNAGAESPEPQDEALFSTPTNRDRLLAPGYYSDEDDLVVHDSRIRERVSPRERPLVLGTVEFDESIFSRPGIQEYTPPLSPRSITPVHQRPGHWDLRGGQTSATRWIIDFKNFQTNFEENLQQYHFWWNASNQVKELSKAIKQLTRALKKLSRTYAKPRVTRLSWASSDEAEKLDADLSNCMEACKCLYAGIMINNINKSRPWTGPVMGEIFRIEEDLPPAFRDLQENLGEMRRRVEKIRNDVRGGLKLRILGKIGLEGY